MTVHCLFEQSGTFKNEFRKLGIEAYDYDILNDFGQTDHVIDLFSEIEKAYSGGASVFDSIKQDDLIMAFFPCVRFEDQIMLWFRGECFSQTKWSLSEKLEHCIRLHSELDNLYQLISKLFLICIKRNLRLIVENPYSVQHYLRNYWCVKPAVIDNDRSERGDYFKKPTQYWFVNCEPSNNFIFGEHYNNKINVKRAIKSPNKGVYERIGCDDRKTARSMIHPNYANRFIREFIIDENGGI